MKIEWLRCPVCGNKTRNRVREDTVLKNYPLYCPKCKREMLINVKQLNMSVREYEKNSVKTESKVF